MVNFWRSIGNTSQPSIHKPPGGCNVESDKRASGSGNKRYSFEMKIRATIEKLYSSPKRLFLLDGCGAILSAFLLGVVLVRLENIFGIPPSALYVLASLPCLFALYDFYCFFKIKHNLGFYLKAIAVVNVLYCCLSMGLAFYHFQKLTFFGWIYIVVEIVIVAALANLEISVANKLNADK
jgi:hypothetical protein